MAEKLKQATLKTIDRLLSRERRVRQLRRKRNPAVQRLLHRKIPVKVASEWDTQQVGNVQVDWSIVADPRLASIFTNCRSWIASGWW